MDSKVDSRKQTLIWHVVNFLQNELTHGNLNDERKESIEVAIQCLETAFELDSEARAKLEKEQLDLLSVINTTPKVDVTEEQINQAEEYKNRGNTQMRNSLYAEAVADYTKAIELNPTNAVYYCNRAAAYSRLGKELETIDDCKEAIKLDPQYGKAYGRLGVAYSNLNKYEDARQAFLTALEYDAGNTTYETNLKLAEEKLYSNMESAAPPEHRPLDISQFINNINNPTLINMATHMLGDPSFRNIISGLMQVGQTGDPNINVLLQAGQNLARRMESEDPNFVENLRRTFGPTQPNSSSAETGGNSKTDTPKEPENKTE
ncbi:hypothetical protein NQ317_018619 [Molorchus minor]|uniref:SGTA homodimerisation domain-containing protein n=1 Tax=Molorchus minor TaxID=1323400 RepID=A0ABQ9JHG2_9CUCU|nr:hypothetical protein NQ317_018619 [Molorchus minor]